MQLSVIHSLLIILAAAVTTFLTRALPFWLFPAGKKLPKVVLYLGKVLPPAIIGLLVVYCMKEVQLFTGNHGLPELAAAVCVVLLHVWKRNNLLSIGGGTILYMVLIQVI